MADVRCPMCSKLNPADSEQCAYCGARLKPLSSQSGEPFNDETADDKPEDVPEWLRSLRTDESPQQADSSFEEGDADDSPDWLSRIRDRAQTEVGEPADETEEETPEWLNSLSSAPAPDQQPDEADDWMSKLSGFQSEESNTQSSAQETPAEQSSAEPLEDFSWLGGFRDQNDQPAADDLPAEEPQENSGFGLTGFLTSLEESSTEQEPPAQGAGQTEPPAPFASELPPSDAPEGLPEWLGGEPPKEAQFAPQAGEGGSGLPEWLQSLSEEPTSSPSAGESDLPDWLGGASGQQDSSEPAEAQPSQQDNLPSWLAGFDESEPDQIENTASEKTNWGDEVSAERPSIEPGADLPSWLNAQDFSEEGSLSEEPQAGQEISGQESRARQESRAGQDVPMADQPQGEVLPDWFSSFEDASATASVPLPQDEETVETAESGGDVPEWLRDFDAQSLVGDTVAPLIEPEAPQESEPVFEGGQPFAVDLPDWLSEDSSQPVGDSSDPFAEATGDDLAQAELPEWVKEMRPIESIIPGAAQMAEMDRKTEKSGPLAGMNGILPAEELASHYSKPPVYTVKLQVTEKQRGQTVQLDTILAQETQPLLIPPQGKSVQGLLLRILVALLLIVALTLPPLMGMQPLAMPALYPVEIQHMYDQIENDLPAEVPVLLAVDFEPGLYGEMRLASLPVLEHLIAKNSHIVVISTRANGPALALNLLTSAAEGHEQYDLAEQVDNLGYLPGDTISLLAFAGQPAFAAPANLSGELAWGRSSLQGISSIRDFSRVIVLTDTAETGRAWVEQVQPLMGEVPLLMVTSAQAAPMMAPFVQSQQVSGMVAGQMGGVLYAQWARQDSPVTGYFASYQVGILLAFSIVLLGGLFSGAMALTKRGQKEGE